MTCTEVVFAWLAAALLLLPAPASAGEYYAGKSIDLLIGAPPGGGYDIYARALVVAKLYASPRDVVMRARQIIAP